VSFLDDGYKDGLRNTGFLLRTHTAVHPRENLLKEGPVPFSPSVGRFVNVSDIRQIGVPSDAGSSPGMFCSGTQIAFGFTSAAVISDIKGEHRLRVFENR
jgi:hypothetical protein